MREEWCVSLSLSFSSALSFCLCLLSWKPGACTPAPKFMGERNLGAKFNQFVILIGQISKKEHVCLRGKY